jgi:hypothetical protein
MPLQTFKVTKELLKQAVEDVVYLGKAYAEHCAISAALRLKYPNVESSGWIIFDRKDGLTTMIPAPDEVQDYIFQFDHSTYSERLALPEFEFTLDVPEAVYIP